MTGSHWGRNPTVFRLSGLDDVTVNLAASKRTKKWTVCFSMLPTHGRKQWTSLPPSHVSYQTWPPRVTRNTKPGLSQSLLSDAGVPAQSFLCLAQLGCGCWHSSFFSIYLLAKESLPRCPALKVKGKEELTHCALLSSSPGCFWSTSTVFFGHNQCTYSSIVTVLEIMCTQTQVSPDCFLSMMSCW